ncbi:Protein CBG27783 [Caenorhabditis briggsae]|uniref:Uncharacterized protein n=2 Tax=Caenorhabditis briggsae TaxID=6238 RepID=A0AAE9FHD9_CAEBR|nr:Protein CBG27783 [Caenorhabditis briggsae]ULT83020.1 hypothetical protein L3Y34_012331 [Caenorhabditis briggsae]UMM42313.1 hypothetical protein L5515_018190 [Caenorhabditis briggsae]CAR99550.1 Protein CBG27783 [Caenorhabditis briggsae]
MVFSEDPLFQTKVPYPPKSVYEFESRNTWRYFAPGEYRNDEYDDTMKEIRKKEMATMTKEAPINPDATTDASVSEEFEDTDDKTPLISSSKN